MAIAKLATRSEGEAWGTILRRVSAMRSQIFGKTTKGPNLLLTERDQGELDRLLHDIETVGRQMMGQAARGVHSNPPLVVMGFNPPAGEQLVSRRVYRLEYRHDEDKENYGHDFAPGVNLYVTRGNNSLVLYRPDGKPLAKDFL